MYERLIYDFIPVKSLYENDLRKIFRCSFINIRPLENDPFNNDRFQDLSMFRPFKDLYDFFKVFLVSSNVF